MRNPAWQRGELIITLDTYFSILPRAPTSSHESVQELSRILRALQPTLSAATQAYRSTASVVMKLMNFRSLDPEYKGTGLTSVSHLDRQIWDDFALERGLLAQLALAIRKASAAGSTLHRDDDVNAIPEAKEGRLLSRLHTERERNRQIIERKKQQALGANGRLSCEVCRFDFERHYGEAGRGIIECHHLTPLAELAREGHTRAEDLALLCANCHRMIHAKKKWLTIAELRAILL